MEQNRHGYLFFITVMFCRSSRQSKILLASNLAYLPDGAASPLGNTGTKTESRIGDGSVQLVKAVVPQRKAGKLDVEVPVSVR